MTLSVRVTSLLAGALVLLALQGCATISGPSEVVSLDTGPRGAKIFATAADDEPLGRTPLFTEVHRGPSHRFSIEDRPDHRVAAIIPCHLRWRPTLLGNAGLSLLFVAASPVVALIALSSSVGLDFADGSAYECTNAYDLNLGSAAKVDPPCRRLLIAPFADLDEEVSDAMSRGWAQQERTQLKGCVDFVPFAKSKGLFRFLNIDHAHPTTYGELGSRSVRSLGMQTGATDMVFLRAVNGGRLAATLFDMHTGKEDPAPPPPVKISNKEGADTDLVPTTRTIIRSVQLLPNSITYSYTNDNIVFGMKPAYVEDTIDRHYSLPKLLSNWGLSSVDHPDGFERWDLHVHLYPGFTSGYISETFHVHSYSQPTDPALQPQTTAAQYDLSFLYFAVAMNGAITLHTPVGAFSPNIGLGLAALAIQDEFQHVTATEPVAKVGFMYVAFITQNIFLRANYDVWELIPGNAQLIDNTVLSVRSFTVASLGIGYFFPQLRSFARKLL